MKLENKLIVSLVLNVILAIMAMMISCGLRQAWENERWISKHLIEINKQNETKK